LLGCIAAMALIIPLVQIVRLNWSISTLEQTSASLAQTALGEAVAPEAAVGALDARLASLRGGGAGFASTAGAVTQAIEATANTELTAVAFGPDGTLRVTMRAAGTAEIDAAQARMRALGLLVTPGVVNPSQGQPLIELQVRGR
jgi:flagellar hook-length control protein FliK